MDDGGLAKFQKRMAAVPKAAREAVVPSLMKQAETIATSMRHLAPDDPSTPAPDLKTSIAVTGPGQRTPAYSQPGGASVVPENQVYISAGNADVRYPHLVEHGTNSHGKHPGTAAQPFFWPAFRLHRKKAVAAIKRSVSKAIKGAK